MKEPTNSWSDGLGNPLANSLPLCQLRELSHLIASVPHPEPPDLDLIAEPQLQYRTVPSTAITWPPAYFWLDTLCVPVSSSYHRKLAIQSMREVYSCSTSVLVIDAFLTTSTAHTTYEELLSRITASQVVWAVEVVRNA